MQSQGGNQAGQWNIGQPIGPGQFQNHQTNQAAMNPYGQQQQRPGSGPISVAPQANQQQAAAMGMFAANRAAQQQQQMQQQQQPQMNMTTHGQKQAAQQAARYATIQMQQQQQQNQMQQQSQMHQQQMQPAPQMQQMQQQPQIQQQMQQQQIQQQQMQQQPQIQQQNAANNMQFQQFAQQQQNAAAQQQQHQAAAAAQQTAQQQQQAAAAMFSQQQQAAAQAQQQEFFRQQQQFHQQAAAAAAMAANRPQSSNQPAIGNPMATQVSQQAGAMNNMMRQGSAQAGMNNMLAAQQQATFMQQSANSAPANMPNTATNMANMGPQNTFQMQGAPAGMVAPQLGGMTMNSQQAQNMAILQQQQQRAQHQQQQSMQQQQPTIQQPNMNLQHQQPNMSLQQQSMHQPNINLQQQQPNINHQQQQPNINLQQQQPNMNLQQQQQSIQQLSIHQQNPQQQHLPQQAQILPQQQQQQQQQANTNTNNTNSLLASLQRQASASMMNRPLLQRGSSVGASISSHQGSQGASVASHQGGINASVASLQANLNASTSHPLNQRPSSSTSTGSIKAKTSVSKVLRDASTNNRPTSKKQPSESSLGDKSSSGHASSQKRHKIHHDSVSDQPLNNSFPLNTWQDRVAFISKNLMGGVASNGFMRATTAAQRLKRQRSRQVCKKDKHPEQQCGSSGGTTNVDPATGLLVPSAVSSSSGTLAHLNRTTLLSLDPSKNIQTEDEKKEVEMFECMNPRTVKKIHSEMVEGISYCTTMLIQIELALKEIDPSVLSTLSEEVSIGNINTFNQKSQKAETTDRPALLKQDNSTRSVISKFDKHKTELSERRSSYSIGQLSDFDTKTSGERLSSEPLETGNSKSSAQRKYRKRESTKLVSGDACL